MAKVLLVCKLHRRLEFSFLPNIKTSTSGSIGLGTVLIGWSAGYERIMGGDTCRDLDGEDFKVRFLERLLISRVNLSKGSCDNSDV